ncbi:MAG: N-acetyltransferase, partial [Chloroflexota bacterium]
IRQEAPGDETAIFEVNVAAFGRDDEAQLVDRLRATGGHLLSLVATNDAGEIIGHVLFTPVAVEGTEEIFECTALGPIAVLPEVQDEGVGAALIEMGMQGVLDMGYDVIFVLGDPDYYGQFGFEQAEPHYIKSEFDVPTEHFLVALGSDNALEGIWGTVYYLPAFKDES